MSELTHPTTDLVSHTPGPWEGDPKGDGLGVRVWDKAGQNMIAALDEDAADSACFVPDIQIREANARLIAAAPEMLDALKAAEKDLATFEAEVTSILPMAKSPALPLIRAAIAKAEGKSDV